MASEARFFITVEWCRNGRRGIFTRNDGNTWNKVDEPHTEVEMFDHMGVFAFILDPQSELFTIEQVKERNCFVALAEYSEQYGIAMTEDVFALSGKRPPIEHDALP